MGTFIIVITTVLIVCIILVGCIFFLKKYFPDLLKLNLSPLGRRGPSVSVEFKEKLNKIVKATESEGPLQSENITEQASLSQVSKDDYIKQLEFKIGTLNKQLLGTATVAATTSDLLNSENVQILENISEQAHDYVMEKQPDSDLVKLVDSFIKTCSVCKWGTKMSKHYAQIEEDPFYAGLGYVKCEKDQKHHWFNDSCDKWRPRPKESQQSKPNN